MLPLPVLGGKYTLERELGRGGSGSVFVARPVAGGPRVAIKFLANLSSPERFDREVALLRRVPPHPNVVGILDAGHGGSVAHIVLELVEGGSLRQQLEAGRVFSIGESVALVERVLRALAHIHAAGVVHRDVTAGNVLIDARGEPRLVDFGLALDVARVTRLTETNAVLGTAHALAPEQVARSRAIGPSADVYAAASLLYSLVARRPPFASAKTFAELEEKIRGEVPQPLDELEPSCPRALAQAVARALSKRPEDRPASAAGFARLLLESAGPGVALALPALRAPESPAPGSPAPAPAPLEPADVGPFRPGARLGPYTLGMLLGQGGMGQVFEARDEALGRDVAIKVLRPGRLSAASEERFEREVVAASRVTHPNIVRVHAVGLERGQRYVVSELVRGESLEGLLRRAGPQEPKRVAAIGRKVALALDALHRAGILHRDVKPGNVLLDEEGEPRLTDFGVAKIEHAAVLTATRQVVGTPLYAPPEQLAGGAVVDARADVYALGATLHELATGRLPYDGASHVLEIFQAKATAPPPLVLARGAPGGPELSAICVRCLAPRPEDRFASAFALATALEAVGRSDAARPVPRSWIATALSATVLACAVVAVARTRGEPAPGLAPTLAPVASVGSPHGGSGHETAGHETKGHGPLGHEPPGHEPGASAQLEGLAETASLDPEHANLVGEGTGPALGDALLDAREAVLKASRPVVTAAALAEAGSLLAHALDLARARLAQTPDDPAGCALRAFATLAQIGAPTRALGPGELGLPGAAGDLVISDLARARDLPGPAGARAAWLLVDVLVCAPRLEPARRACREAVARAPDDPARASLERVLGAAPSVDGFRALLEGFHDSVQDTPEVTKTRRTAAALELSRFFARLGAPAACERPEAATDTGAVEATLAHEPPWLLRLDLDAALVPEAAPALVSSTELVSSAVLDALASARCLSAVPRLAKDFPNDRPVVPRDARWETGRGAAGCTELDRRLREDVARDTRLAAARGGKSGLELERVVRGLGALRRLQALESEADLPADERTALAFEALLGAEELKAALGGAALPFRARVRAVALPPPLGSELARLDLERMGRLLHLAFEHPAAAACFPELGELAKSVFATRAALPRERLAPISPADPPLPAFVPGLEVRWTFAGAQLTHEVGRIDGDAWVVHPAIERAPRGLLALATSVAIPAGLHEARFELGVDRPGRGDEPVAQLRVSDRTTRTVLGLRTVLRRELTERREPAERTRLTEVAVPFACEGGHELELAAYWPGGVLVRAGPIRVTGAELAPTLVLDAVRDLRHRVGRAEAKGWGAKAGRDPIGHLCYGPYTTQLGAGWHEARFALASDEPPDHDDVLGRIEVSDPAHDHLLVERDVSRHELGAAPGEVTDVPVIFQSERGQPLEFRIGWPGKGHLNVRSVVVTDVPSEVTRPLTPPRAAAYREGLEVVLEAKDLVHEIGHEDGDGWAAALGTDRAGLLAKGRALAMADGGAREARFVLGLVGAAGEGREAVAVLEAWDVARQKIAAERNVYASELGSEGLVEALLPFAAESGHEVELRVRWTGTASLRVQRVEVYKRARE